MKPKREVACKPGGPWCIGMRALLAADVRGGVQIGFQLNSSIASVVCHTARHEGQKSQMLFSWCPCCGAKLTKKEKR